ncbi:mitochondrial carrier domain-containing protein [Cadophora sp. MPI-SDFR-AT-0126]|nr:mitochondrial carrier domain-containing protein [Leotiomycetes sp. MPI-SDFR-AT-0126]
MSALAITQVVPRDLPAAAPSVKREHITPGLSLFAGGVAGGVEAATTYPFEFAKTRSQLGSKTSGKTSIYRLLKNVVKTEGISGLYTGCSTLVVGTAFKAGVRFLTFDTIKQALADDNGKISGGRAILAGSLAGCVESVLAVTPTERLKTALIDDSRSQKRFKGTFHAARVLVAERGLGNLYRGLASTTMKQSATSAVRMGSYTIMRDASKRHKVPQNTLTTFLTGAAAGTITVYATQPFDTVKTRAQSSAGAGTLEAMVSVLKDSGIRGFWAGSTMRLGRLVLSGGIVFSVYDNIVNICSRTGHF